MTRLSRWAGRARAVRLDDLRAFAWAHRSLTTLRPALAALGTEARVAAPPPLEPWAVRSVALYLRLRRATCFERTLTLQSWLVAHGRPVAIGIGVRTDGGFRAHAWLADLDPPSESAGYEEIRRIAP